MVTHTSMSLCFEWVHICGFVVEYDWYMLIVDCYIECIVYARNKVVWGFSQFGSHNLNGLWHK